MGFVAESWASARNCPQEILAFERQPQRSKKLSWRIPCLLMFQ